MVNTVNGVMFMRGPSRSRKQFSEKDDFFDFAEEVKLKKQSLHACHFTGCDDELFYCFKRGNDTVYKYACAEHLPQNSNEVFNFGKIDDLADNVVVKCMLRDTQGHLCEKDASYYISETNRNATGSVRKSQEENANLTAFCKEHEPIMRTNPYLIRQRKSKNQLNRILKEDMPKSHNAKVQYDIVTNSGLKHVVFMWLALYTNEDGQRIYVSEGRLGPKAVCQSKITSECTSTRGINGSNECVGCDEAWRLFRRRAPKGEYTTKD